MTLTVWSEQGETYWRDCTQRTYQMLMVYGGVAPSLFRLGINTLAEGERFEDAEGLPETSTSASAEAAQERGLYTYRLCDVAAQKLYGAVAHDASEADLPGLLNTVGLAIGLSGQGPGLPGVPRYPGGYASPHNVCFVPIGNGQAAVYDPLNTMGAGPGVLPTSTVLAWHRRLPNDIRSVREGEFKEIEMAATTVALGVPIGFARVNNDPHVRGITTTGQPTVLLTPGADYPVYGEIVIPGFVDPPAFTSAAWRIAVDGETRLLKRNAVFTPLSAPVQFHLAGTVNPDGSVTLAK